MTQVDMGQVGVPPGDKRPKDLNIGIGIKDNLVHIAFGAPIAWLAMSPAQAYEFARLIRDRARKLQIAAQRQQKR